MCKNPYLIPFIHCCCVPLCAPCQVIYNSGSQSHQIWWHMPLIPTSRGRSRRINEFQASQIFMVSSRPPTTTIVRPYLKKESRQDKPQRSLSKCVLQACRAIEYPSSHGRLTSSPLSARPSRISRKNPKISRSTDHLPIPTPPGHCKGGFVARSLGW